MKTVRTISVVLGAALAFAQQAVSAQAAIKTPYVLGKP